MDDTIEKPKRPTSITVICVLGFIGALITVPLIFTQTARQFGAWYPPFLAFAAVSGFACLVGLWMMKKWAAYAYTGLTVINQIIMLVMGIWTIMALIFPAILIFFAMRNISKMT